jgi:hypothetical protein
MRLMESSPREFAPYLASSPSELLSNYYLFVRVLATYTARRLSIGHSSTLVTATPTSTIVGTSLSQTSVSDI